MKEAIEIIDQFLKNAHDCGRLQMQQSGLSAKNLYTRLAALCEFPARRIRDYLKDLVYDYKAEKTAGEPAIEYYTNKIKREWPFLEDKPLLELELPEDCPKECPILIKGNRYRLSGLTDKPIEFLAGHAVTLVQIGDIERQPTEGVCLKCEGSKKIRWATDVGITQDLGVPEGFIEKDCFQCAGTGRERRMGEERRDEVSYWKRRECCQVCYFSGGQSCRRYAPRESENGRPIFPLIIDTYLQWCGEFKFRDQRSGQDRRSSPQQAPSARSGA